MDRNWSKDTERGTRFSLRLVVWILRRLGEAPLHILVAPIALYFSLFAREARRASVEYLTRLNAHRGIHASPGFQDIYRHFYSFSEGIYDRIVLWSGGLDRFEIVLHGRESMKPMVDDGRGAFLVGAHMGSFDILRVIAREADIPVNVLMYTANAERINETFAELDPTSKVRIIDLDPGSPHVTLRVRRCLERGEFVAILADRVQPGGGDRVTTAEFLGKRAAFPQGPFLLPMVLGVPALMVLALRSGPQRYDVFLESLADGKRVPPRGRAEAVRERVETYASRLEHYCSVAPLQWFNFYDFWIDDEDDGR